MKSFKSKISIYSILLITLMTLSLLSLLSEANSFLDDDNSLIKMNTKQTWIPPIPDYPL